LGNKISVLDMNCNLDRKPKGKFKNDPI
jgi:hypothetical protein